IPVERLHLPRQGWLHELKTLVDAIEVGARHGAFAGINGLLSSLLRFKDWLRRWFHADSKRGGDEKAAGAFPLVLCRRPAMAVLWTTTTVGRRRIETNRR